MASSEHTWTNCPYIGVNRVEPIDLNRSNHFYHDSLGCPFECGDDHNHPTRVNKTTE